MHFLVLLEHKEKRQISSAGPSFCLAFSLLSILGCPVGDGLFSVLNQGCFDGPWSGGRTLGLAIKGRIWGHQMWTAL